LPRFPEYFVQQVAQATDIVDLVSQYVALKKRGREFLGLCPFHDDHKPSLNVSPTKQIFKCFSCGAGGGVFQFLILYEKLSFPEAVRSLAERANMPVPRELEQEPQADGLSKNDLVRVTTFASEFFRAQLAGPAGKAALDYARKRGLTDASIDRFGLGFAPDSWDSLLRSATAKGIGQQQLVAAGMAIRRQDKNSCYDRFRSRLMFPIFDAAGKVIAFGGRAMSEQGAAKYLNSAESILFDKSSNLYAMNWAREAVVSSRQAIVVEGYLDALIPLQAGVDNVVATLGTALTDRHVRLLSHYADEVVLVFDADAAGTAAAERALEVFLAQQVNIRVATIPVGKDPCDYCLAEGPEALKGIIAQAPDALQYVWLRRQEAYQAAGGKLADQHRLVEDFLRLVASSSAYGAIDEVRRGQLAQHIGHMLNIPPRDLQQQMRRLSRRVRPGARPAAAPSDAAPAQEGPTARAERHLLEVLLNCPDLLDSVCERVDPEDFRDPGLRAVAQCAWRLGQQQKLTLEHLLALPEMAGLGGLVADLAATGEDRGNYQDTLSGAVELILYRRDQQALQELKSAGMDDDESLRQLHQRMTVADARRRPRIS